MNNINFYEVIDRKGRWMGSYSPQLDSTLNIGIGAFQMAQINAKYHGGEVHQVTFDGERELVWPK